MAPIRITSEEPICICVGERELYSISPTIEPFVAEEIVYVRPKDKGTDYTVKVKGFRDAPGGIVETQRLSPGHNVDDLTLTTPYDPDLSEELGVSEVIIDGIRYTATNPSHS
jgi:hypothetical protein